MCCVLFVSFSFPYHKSKFSLDYDEETKWTSFICDLPGVIGVFEHSCSW